MSSENNYTEQQVKSKQRVADHGEVFTAAREVNAMLDLVKHETERIDSRFLEPACGDGNFLVEILNRKLAVVKAKYQNSHIEYERYSILAISSIYGIDILQDNVEAARVRLLAIFSETYIATFKSSYQTAVIDVAQYILSKNIIWGDALTLATPETPSKPVIFAEWAMIGDGNIKRRDFSFSELMKNASPTDLPLFSDLGVDVFIPRPLREYPVVHFLKLSDL